MRHGRGLLGETRMAEAAEVSTLPSVEVAAGPADREETEGAAATGEGGGATGRADDGPMTRSRARATAEPGAAAREAAALAAERRAEVERRATRHRELPMRANKRSDMSALGGAWVAVARVAAPSGRKVMGGEAVSVIVSEVVDSGLCWLFER